MFTRSSVKASSYLLVNYANGLPGALLSRGVSPRQGADSSVAESGARGMQGGIRTTGPRRHARHSSDKRRLHFKKGNREDGAREVRFARTPSGQEYIVVIDLCAFCSPSCRRVGAWFLPSYWFGKPWQKSDTRVRSAAGLFSDSGFVYFLRGMLSLISIIRYSYWPSQELQGMSYAVVVQLFQC